MEGLIFDLQVARPLRHSRALSLSEDDKHLDWVRAQSFVQPPNQSRLLGEPQQASIERNGVQSELHISFPLPAQAVLLCCPSASKQLHNHLCVQLQLFLQLNQLLKNCLRTPESSLDLGQRVDTLKVIQQDSGNKFPQKSRNQMNSAGGASLKKRELSCVLSVVATY